MDSLRGALLDRFVGEMAIHLTRQFPACAKLEAADFRQRIRAGIEQAEKHGVQAEYDVRRFLELLVEHEWELGASRFAVEILEAEDLDGTEKMDRIDAARTFASR